MPLLSKEHLKIAQQNGLKPRTVSNRVYNLLWEVERAITEPKEEHKDPVWEEWKETALGNGICKETFNSRRRRGKDNETAATQPLKPRWRKN